MVIRTIDESWQDERGGQTSFLLLGGREGTGSARLAVTWVEAPAGSEQPRHAHSVSEQAYVIVAGRGKMNVESTSFDVAPGTLILIEPGERHSIRSVGHEPLVYISATVPPFEIAPGQWSTAPREHKPVDDR
jgi:mannose-6-phosphate isomerase-like protein (cupin superfamily)